MIRKQIKNYVILSLLSFAFLLPSSAFAQSFYEGQSEGEVKGWWSRSSDFRDSIDDLDDDILEDVPMPILFGITPLNMTRNFGDPRSGGRKHEGLDIMAPKGALVVSPSDAVVLRTGFGDSAGNYVYTANPGGETFVYMHLDEIADIDEGDELNRGDLIGYVGNTGNATGGSPHLHFEIVDEDENPTDPYPRITVIFPLADKIEYLEKIIDDADDEEEFVEKMVAMYRKDFNLAITNNIELPELVDNEMKKSGVVATAPVKTSVATSVPVAVSNSAIIPMVNLTIGAKGSNVVSLQKFLISKNVGSAGKIKADGSFGPMTQKALAEYQASVGIKPSAGYYGSITRAYILKNA